VEIRVISGQKRGRGWGGATRKSDNFKSGHDSYYRKVTILFFGEDFIYNGSK